MLLNIKKGIFNNEISLKVFFFTKKIYNTQKERTLEKIIQKKTLKELCSLVCRPKFSVTAER